MVCRCRTSKRRSHHQNSEKPKRTCTNYSDQKRPANFRI